MNTNDFSPFTNGLAEYTSHENRLAYGTCLGIEEENYFFVVHIAAWFIDKEQQRRVPPQDESMYAVLRNTMQFVKSRYDVERRKGIFQLHHKSIRFQRICVNSYEQCRFTPFIGGNITFMSHLKDMAYGKCVGIEEDDFFYDVFVEDWSLSADTSVSVTTDNRIHKTLQDRMRYLKSGVTITERNAVLEFQNSSFRFGGLSIEKVV